MKRIGLISDTHGYFDKRYAKYFSACDEIWHAGDIGNIEIIDRLNKITKTRVVYGNIDNHTIRAEFPINQSYKIEGVNVFMTHIGGKPYSYTKRITNLLSETKPDLFICGHSHICKIQMDKKLNMLYMNPGAAGINGFHKVRTLIRFSIEGKKIYDCEVIELGNRVKSS